MTQNKNIDERVTELKADYEARAEMRKNFERNWLLDINFYNGNQYSEVLSTGEITDAIRKYSWQEESVFNHIAPLIDSRLSRFNKINSEVSCVAASSDADDVNSAKFSTRLLKSVKESERFKKLTEEAIYWAELTGTVFYKICWDKHKGMCLSPERGIYEGDVNISICPPYEIYPDSLTAEDIDSCMSIIHAKAYSVEKAESIWGVKLSSDKINVLGTVGSYVSRNKLGRGTRLRADCNEVDGHVLIIERYSAPTKEYPEGRLLIVGGDKVLYDGVLPYINRPNGKRGFPFVRQVALPRPASFYGMSLIDRLIPIQRAYNEIKNRKHEFFNRLTAGVLLAEDGSVDADDLAEEGISPGRIIVYRQGCAQPQMLNLGSVPTEFGEEEDRLLKEFIHVSGVTDFFISGTLNGTNMSGTALNLIIEQDNNRLSVTTESIREAVKNVSEQILRLYKQFATGSRLLKIAGEDGKMMITHFKGNDISADNIVFDLDEDQVNTAANRRELVNDIFNMGLLNDSNGQLTESTKRKLLEVLGFGVWDNAPNIDELQKSRANKENNNIKIEVPEVNELDDHKIHIEEHMRFALGDEQLTETDRKALCKHIEGHRIAMSKTEN